MWVLSVSTLIIILYAIASLVLPLRLSWRHAVLSALIIVLFGLKYEIYRFTGGILEPHLAASTIVLLESTYSALLLAALLALLKDLALLGRTLYRLVVRVPKERRPWPLKQIHVAIVLFAVIVGFSGTLSQYRVPDVYTVPIAVKGLASELNNYKIVQITDLHIGPILQRDFLQGVVDKINAEKPDLVVITGDFVDGSVERLKNDFLPLQEIKAKDGILAVTGNHEYYSSGDAISWVNALEQMGVHFLKNESVLLSQANAESKEPEKAAVLVSGVPDQRGEMFGEDKPDFALALRQFKQQAGGERIAGPLAATNVAESAVQQASFRLLLAHEPIIVTQNPNVDLILTGHTHGGTMFFLKPLVASFNAGYVSGLYDVNERTKLYVSNGTGIWSGFSCRVLVPAEITSFVLQAK